MAKQLLQTEKSYNTIIIYRLQNQMNSNTKLKEKKKVALEWGRHNKTTTKEVTFTMRCCLFL